MHRFLTLAVVAGVFLPTPGRADWPDFRGPTGQGQVTSKVDLPIEWNATKNVTWKQSIPGKGWSSPVIAAGKIYLTTAVSQRGEISLRALALDGKTGKILWDREVFRHDDSIAIHSKNSHASPTPLVQDGRLYVHFGHQGTACLDLQGKILWQTRELKYRPVHGNGGTPVIVEDLLIFHCDGASDPFVVALERGTGKVKWKTPRPLDADRKFSFCTPLVIEVQGKKQLISPASDQVNALDPATGKVLWSVRYRGYSVIPRPVYGHGLLFLSTGYDSPVLLAIQPGPKEGKVVWRETRAAPHTPSPLLVGDELYVVSDAGVASCLDAKTGKLHWRERLGGRGYSASPIHAAGKIWFLSENGVGTVIKAGKTFEKLAQNEMNERTLASYAVADGALFLRTETRLYRIEKR